VTPALKTAEAEGRYLHTNICMPKQVNLTYRFPKYVSGAILTRYPIRSVSGAILTRYPIRSNQHTLSCVKSFNSNFICSLSWNTWSM